MSPYPVLLRLYQKTNAGQSTTYGTTTDFLRVHPPDLWAGNAGSAPATPAPPPPPPGEASSGPTPPPEHLRRVLRHRYRIEHRIGGGTMADVYRARDLQEHGWVAVKVFAGPTATSVPP